MEKKYLAILEVSQKQEFIFSSNRLKDNVINSAIIAWVTSSRYFEEEIKDRELYNPEKNLVYSGGGHTILIFDDREKARNFVKRITGKAREDYEGLELFAHILECSHEITNEDLKTLTEELEIKKNNRKSAFHQGSFGIEAPTAPSERQMPEAEKEIDRKLTPDSFHQVLQLDRLGGSRNESNFIAVVHIDGNSMGKRVMELRESMKDKNWEDYRRALRRFSDSIDAQFKEAYAEMAEVVAEQLRGRALSELKLEPGDFPVRRIITAGDDICFVSEGRIGIECARIFIQKLSGKINAQDHRGYAACAGVAVVHEKYPFYRAYELAEELCGSAKRFIADAGGVQAGSSVCAIDWHIEYGEMKENLEEIRKMYRTMDGGCLELRPYIVSDPQGLLPGENIRQYDKFRKLICGMQKEEIGYAKGKLKELRQYLKEGEDAAKYYMQSNHIEDLALIGYQDIYTSMDCSRIGAGTGMERKIFVETADGVKRSLFFDAIELMDTFLAVEG